MRLAASALGEAGDPGAGDALVQALADPDPNVIAAAADALGALRYRPALDRLVELCAADELWLRAAAVVALGRLEDDRAVPVLTSMAGEQGLEKPIAEALGRINHPSGLEALEQIHGTDPDVALRTAGAILTAHPDAEPPQWFLEEARRQVDSLRRELADADDPAIACLLGLAGTPKAIETLADLLAPPRRSEAAIAGLLTAPADARADPILDRLQDADVQQLTALLAVTPPLLDRSRIERLVPFLSHGNETVRAAAAEALGRAPAGEALPLLLDELDHEDDVADVVRALGGLGESACGALIPLLEDPSSEVRAAAAAALSRCAGSAILGDLRTAIEAETDPRALQALLRAAGRVGGEEAVEPLSAALGADDLDTRLAALEALGHTGDPGAVPAIEKAVGGSTHETLAGVQALGALGGKAILPLLERFLTADDVDVRRSAARAAISAAADLSGDRVEALVADDDAWVRMFGARVLAARAARDRLDRIASEDPDSRVREEARRLLRETGP